MKEGSNSNLFVFFDSRIFQRRSEIVFTHILYNAKLGSQLGFIRRHGSVSALKCMRDEMHRVPLREPASCEHP